MTIHKTDPSNKFKNEHNNYYGRELFLEFNTKPGIALYTLQDHDYKGKISLYLRYINEADPSEYTFANTYFDGWRHWERIQKQPWFQPYILRWREELAIKLQAEAVNKIIELSEKGGREALAASRYIAERGWEKKTNQRGRPIKTPDPAKLEKELSLEETQLEEDFERIILNG